MNSKSQTSAADSYLRGVEGSQKSEDIRDLKLYRVSKLFSGFNFPQMMPEGAHVAEVEVPLTSDRVRPKTTAHPSSDIAVFSLKSTISLLRMGGKPRCGESQYS